MSASVAERIRVRASALGLLADTPVVTLLSGGADSTLLAVSLAELGCAARLVHVAHGLRHGRSRSHGEPRSARQNPLKLLHTLVPQVAMGARARSSVFLIAVIMPLPLRSLDVCAPPPIVKAARGLVGFFF